MMWLTDFSSRMPDGHLPKVREVINAIIAVQFDAQRPGILAVHLDELWLLMKARNRETVD